MKISELYKLTLHYSPAETKTGIAFIRFPVLQLANIVDIFVESKL